MFDFRKEYKKILDKTIVKGKSSGLENRINQIIWNLISSLPEHSKVIIRGGGVHTEQLFTVIRQKFSYKEFSVVAIVDDGLCGDKIDKSIVISKKEAEKLEYGTVILSSFSHSKEMKKDYEFMPVNVIDLYEEFTKRGIYLAAPFYYYKKKNYEIALYYTSQYKREKSKKNLEWVIDAVLEVKDFIAAQYYIQEYIKSGYDINNIYHNLQNDLQNLFANIQSVILKRGGKDIIMFWVDAVPYIQLEWLGYVYKKKETSCFFENVYTVTPYTRPTMHTLLQGNMIIDNYEECIPEIDETNSEVIQDLQDAGYDYLYVGYNGAGNISSEYRIKNSDLDHEHAKMISACTVYWEMLCELAQCKKTVFCMAHSAVETHEPYISLSLDDMRSYQISEILEKGQNKQTYQYLDKQLEFYSGFLGEDTTKIYMSDHGNIVDWNKWKFTEQRIKTFFLIEGKRIMPRFIDDIFSYKNFKYIVKWLLHNSENDLQSALSDFAMVQEVDTWDSHAVANYIKKGNKESGMSFRGVVTKKDKYFRIGNGNELYFVFSADGEENISEIEENLQRVEELRELAGNKFLNIAMYEQFKASVHLYE